MKVNLREFSAKLKKTLFFFNIFIVVIIVAVFIVYTVLKGIYGVNEIKWLGIINISLFVLFALLNLSLISIEIIRRKTIEKKIFDYINKKQYKEAIIYIRKVGNKKNTYSTNQRLFYYLGYLELISDRVDESLYYFQQFNIENQYLENIDCYVSVIYFMYLIHFINDNDIHLKNVTSIYELKKDLILKTRTTNRTKKDIKNLFETIEFFNNGDQLSAIKKLKNSRSIDIPLIKRYVMKY